ncbi:lipopolysaccharide transport periplasmic protein LptA [Chromatiales bacterium (ex Bugula neritina AB1)]|nr:lipopolysaccharide transport periplasmic protein LptA [Chromatiales bacterium (ex Bugula neritina AB1)]
MAVALENDYQQPVSAKADRLELDQQSGSQQFSGNVEITQGSIVIQADKLHIETRNGAIYRISGSGNPIRFRQLDNDKKLIIVEGNRLDYVTPSWTVIFTGNVKVTRAAGEFSGHSIEYNLRKQQYKAKGNNRNRVSITLNPG